MSGDVKGMFTDPSLWPDENSSIVFAEIEYFN